VRCGAYVLVRSMIKSNLAWIAAMLLFGRAIRFFEGYTCIQ
jgi:hypothetical protein